MSKGRSSPSGPVITDKLSLTIAHADMPTATVQATTIALAGVRSTDRIVVNATAALPANIGLLGGRVTADDQVELSLINPTVGTITVGSQTYSITVLRFSA
jgi:hypothetical protein